MNNRRNQLMLASAREYCKCVVEGKTIKYNQIVENGNFVSTSDWSANNGTFSVSNNICSFNATYQNGDLRTSVGNNIVIGHKYFISLDIKVTTAPGVEGIGIYFGYEAPDTVSFAPNNANWNNIGYITTSTNQGVDYLLFIRDFRTTRDTIYVKNVQIIDLTELGLDNINSVADFYATDLGKYIRKGNYLETTSGAFIQAKTPINFKGVNIWNEKTTLVSSHLESENINCLPNKNYYFSCSREGFAVIGTIYWYDKNGTQLDYNDFSERNIVSPSNSVYFKLVFNGTYGTTYNHDICISENVWDENWEKGGIDSSGTFVPYDAVRSKLISVMASQKYLASFSQYTMHVFYYDKNKAFISYEQINPNTQFATPKNCEYIAFQMSGYYGVTYNNDIAIFYVGYQKYCGRTGKVFVIDYNQQIKNGNFATTDDWDLRSATLSVSDNVGNISRINGASAKISQTIKLVATHKYAIMFKAKVNIPYTYSRLVLNGNRIDSDFIVDGAGSDWQDFGWIMTNPYLNGDYALDLYLNLDTNFLGFIDDFYYVKEFNVIDLTALGMDNISTISDFNNTDLGQLIAEKGYLPYSQRNVDYALGKQLQNGDYYKTYGVDKVSYNQLVQNGNFQDTSNWLCENGTIQANGGSLTYEITAIASNFAGNRVEQAFSHTTGHKYLVLVDFLCPYDTILNIYVGDWVTLGTAQANIETTLVKICTAVSTGNNNLYFDIYGQPSYSVGDRITVYKYMKIDLTALGLDNITTIEEFYRTPLGMLVKKGFYLNYTTSNKTIKTQLIRTMKEIDMEDLNWQSDEIGMYAPLPSDCKKVEDNEIPNLLATNYKTSSSIGAQYMDIFIGNEWGLGWCFVVRYLYDFPTGKLMYELNTPIIVDEDIEDIMVSRRTIGVESDNGVDLDFTKE